MPSSTKTEQRAFLFLLALLVLIFGALCYPFLNALVLAVVFAVLFQPLNHLNLKWTKGRANLSAFLSLMAVVVLLVLPLAAILTMAMTQLGEIIAPSASQGPAVPPSVSTIVQHLQQKISFLAGKLETLLGLQVDLVPFLRKTLSESAKSLARYSPQVIAETANFFLHFFVMLILLFYLLRDGEKLLLILIRITPIKDRYERRLAAEIQSTIRGVFHGNFIMGLIQAVLAAIGFLVLGIDGYLVWGALVFFTSFLPSIGTGAVIVPMIVYLFLQGRNLQAIILIFYGLVFIGSIDNLIRPHLMRQNMHPMFLFLGIFGGLAVFGPIGILLGPMLMALLTATVRIYAEDFAGVSIAAYQPAKKDPS